MSEEDFALQISEQILDDERLGRLRRDVATMCKSESPSIFPGSQPVSMDRENMKYLSKVEYCVCEKTDGVRFLLLIYRNNLYFIDRRYDFFYVKNVKLEEAGLCLKNLGKGDVIDFSNATVLDGELLEETKTDKPYICFWVFDVMCMNSRNVGNLSLLNRLHLIRTWVVSPLNELISQNKLTLPFQLRMKPMYSLDQTVFVWNDVVQHLTHECDGLIFTPIRDPYTIGTCYKLLKWKPIEFNSADFKIETVFYENERKYRLQVLMNGLDGNYDWVSFETQEEESMYGRSGIVVECIFDFNRWTFIPFWDGGKWIPSPNYNGEKGPGWRKGGWKPIRIRPDKSVGNAIRTVENVVKSISDNISMDDLAAVIKQKHYYVC